MKWSEKLHFYLESLKILEEAQFKVYYELLVNSQGKGLRANEILDRVSFNRSYVYNILAALKEKGLVYTIPESPTLYAANDPSGLVRELISQTNSHLAQLNEFLTFIEQEARPQLEKQKKVSALPLKQVFFIDSMFVLKSRVMDLLPRCKNRILIQAPATFITDIGSSLESGITVLEQLQKETHEKKEICVILLASDSDERAFSFSNYLVSSSIKALSTILVLDNTTFVFNVRPEVYNLPFGMGMVIENKDIADSYAHQLKHAWKEELYENLPKSTLNDLFYDMKSDPPFSTAMSSLFQRGWRIIPHESSVEAGYLHLLSSEVRYFNALREAGIRYVPLGETPAEELIPKIFEETKKITLNKIILEEARGLLTVGVQELKETIDDFECLTMAMQMNTSDWAMWEERYGLPSEVLKNHYSGKMVVFNYLNRAVIMIWAITTKDVYEIIKILSKTT
ncbi:MAG: helix-turn-helix domain-containing protein [Promethearchaeota archaeon]